ncbi:PREDICTED: DNA polymerase subunit gamma-1, mitochondrial [Polistes canadensis]|uniref:DNA polymerase subunit gamma-1, mitochondrial n=1 Tax=Polistes canadensis TaxID=91411 RepID=UPI000718AEEB|nr:PREDICTED: DNA polymerase subunit gamma-1, mitochondrial [Polistes canadensis]
MRIKTRLIHICIRHKCTTSKDDSFRFKQFVKKKLILRNKKSENCKVSSSNSGITSNHVTSNINDPFCKESNSNIDIFSFSSKDKTDTNISKEFYAINEPKLPDNFEQAFLFPLKDQNYSSQIKHSNNSNKYTKNIQDKNIEQSENDNKNDNINSITRFNEINMQMLSKPLHEYLFNKNEKHVHLPQDTIDSIKKNLQKYGINTENVKPIPDIDISLPPLKGKDLEEHFYNIAMEQIAPYLNIVNKIITVVPEMPSKWLLQKGWTRYTSDGAECVNYPLEEEMILDVEVCMKEGPLPTLATAVTNKAWYGWVSPILVENVEGNFGSNYFTPNMLIPIESNADECGIKLNNYHQKPKIIIGHNVSYDRMKIKEQYWLNSTATRFIDTMSMHICVSGLNSYQRTILKSEQLNKSTENWVNSTSTNSLSEVHKLYCGENISKEQRNIFVEGSLDDIREQFNDLMSYCASDVLATYRVFHKLFPIFQERFPHPVTFAGMLELGCAYLPVNSNWQRYLEEAESTYEDLNYESKIILTKRADTVCKLMHNEKYKENLWMWDQDWSTQNIKMKNSLSQKKLQELKEKENNNKEIKFVSSESYLTDEEDEDPLQKEFSYLEETKYLLPARVPYMAGYPSWYRKLCPKHIDENWEPGPQLISTSMQITPKLLNLTWENYPLHYIKEHGWGILVPYSDDLDVETKLPLKQLLEQCPLSKSTNFQASTNDTMLTLNKEVEKDLYKVEFWRYKKREKADYDIKYKGSGIWCDVILDNSCYFFKLPHKDGINYNVGNPLAKDFLNKFSDNILAGLDSSATQILKIARKLSYWRNNRDRIMSQMVVWFEKHCLPNNLKKHKIRYGAIIPQVVVCGTLTRRAVEPTWMTASNAHVERIGSELRSMIQAPPGYNIVGADVDSQELWIASIIGDAYYMKVHGATPFGWMTLIGNKSNGTDMHSVTAKAIGISRDHAKVINYARIYGAGQKFAERLLKQFNPTMAESEAVSKSRKMFALTKGNKVYTLKSEYINEDFEDKKYSTYEAIKLAKAFNKPLKEMFNKSKWIGGSESAMFNRLEEIACSSNPVTPFLNCRLSRALENNNEEEKYLPTKVNWVVQSGAVDFLHLMLVSMRWLMQDNARFCLSFHDEVRYLVPSRYKYNAALAMHITNLMTRSFCALRLGMNDLPMSVAFFASVEVDTVLRKESSQDSKTPSNPHGLESGYGIPIGESLDIHAALEKSGRSLGSWHRTKRDKKKT